jgi:hypothetical protein
LFRHARRARRSGAAARQGTKEQAREAQYAETRARSGAAPSRLGPPSCFPLGTSVGYPRRSPRSAPRGCPRGSSGSADEWADMHP